MATSRVKPVWHLVDAQGQIVGRLATQLARILQGKHKPYYAPNIDCGDHVVVINAKDVVFTGDKWKKKVYYWHTGYPGGLKQQTAREKLAKKPESIIKDAVSRMLPKNKMRKSFQKKLIVFADDKHTFQEQLGETAKSIV